MAKTRLVPEEDLGDPTSVAGAALSAAIGEGAAAVVADAAPVVSLKRSDFPPDANHGPTIQAALDSLDTTIGGTVELPVLPSTRVYRLDGTLVVGPRKALRVPSGAELWRLAASTASTAPMVVLNGNRAKLLGDGLIRSENDAPFGHVLVGPEVITRRSYSAAMTSGSAVLDIAAPGDGESAFEAGDVGKSITVWAAGNDNGTKLTATIVSYQSATQVTLSKAATTTVTGDRAYWGEQKTCYGAQVSPGIQIRGNESANSVGVYLNSSPQGQTGITLGCRLGGQVERVHTAYHFGPQANGNEVKGYQVQRITGAVFYFDDAVENNVEGGFIHGSGSLQAIVKGRRAIYNSVANVTAEPGGVVAKPWDLDATSTQNTIQIMSNLPVAGTDAGTRNTLWDRDIFGGHRIRAQDGVVTKTVAGPVDDTAFTRSAENGLVVLDTTTHRIYAREGTVWRYAKLRARDISQLNNRDFPSIPAHSTAEMTVTVTGAVAGDCVTITPTTAPENGLMWAGYVSAVNTVTIRLANVTTAAIDPGNRGFSIHVYDRA